MQGDLSRFIGLELSEFKEKALENGYGCVRVVEKDGESFMVTMDYRTDRVNVAVKTTDGKEIVTKIANIG